MKELSISQIQFVSAGNFPVHMSKIIVMGACSYGIPLLMTIAMGAALEAMGCGPEVHAHLMPLYMGFGAMSGLSFGIYLTSAW
jgi:hypothetical protein